MRQSPTRTEDVVSIEDLLEELQDDGESRDLYDTLYSDRRDFADFVDWPLDDDESQYAGD